MTKTVKTAIKSVIVLVTVLTLIYLTFGIIVTEKEKELKYGNDSNYSNYSIEKVFDYNTNTMMVAITLYNTDTMTVEYVKILLNSIYFSESMELLERGQDVERLFTVTTFDGMDIYYDGYEYY
jgi:hypothetical protein